MIRTAEYSKQTNFNKLSQTISSSFRRIVRDLPKRLFDISASLIGLIILLPIFAYVAYLITRDSFGPVFYWGPRMGRNGKPFRILKFRTMYEDQRSYNGPRVTAKGDDRITPFGHWLRDTKINELPQLWNVLIGEMSLVGPRPEDVKIAENWPEDATTEILSVRPGITSPASVLYHDEEKLLSKTNLMEDYFKSILPDKMRLDRLYVRHHSLASDIDIIFWTLAILVPRIAGTRIPEGYIFAGPLSRLVRRHISWFILDLLTAMIVVSIAALLWQAYEPLNWGGGHLAFTGAIFAFLFSSVNYLFGVNRIVWSRAKAEDALVLVFSSAIVTVSIIGINFLEGQYRWFASPVLPTSMLFTIGLMASAGFIAVRYRLRLISAIASRWLTWRKEALFLGERLIVIGSGEPVRIVNWLLRLSTFRTAFSIVGVVDNNDPTLYGMRIDGCWMLGSLNDLPALIAKHDIGVIVSTLPQDTPETKFLLEMREPNLPRIIFLGDLLWMVEQQVAQPIGEVDFPTWLDDRLEFSALYDKLTKLPNRSLFQDRLRHSLTYAKRYATKRAVMFIELSEIASMQNDLDRNAILKEAAQRLNKTKRDSDTLTRFNGSQFALLLENVPDQIDAWTITQRISNALSVPFTVSDKTISINPHIHISLCAGACGALEAPKNAEIKKCYECVTVNQSAEFKSGV